MLFVSYIVNIHPAAQPRKHAKYAICDGQIRNNMTSFSDVYFMKRLIYIIVFLNNLGVGILSGFIIIADAVG